MTCSGNKKSYEVYLAPEGGKWDKKDSQNKVTLQIIDKSSGSEGKVVWGPNLDVGIRWKKWEINFMPVSNFVTLLPANLENNNQGHGTTTTCNSDKKVSLWSRSNGISTVFWKVENENRTEGVQFKLNNCNTDENKKSCDIEFDGDNSSRFQWNNGFKPKAFFANSPEQLQN